MRVLFILLVTCLVSHILQAQSFAVNSTGDAAHSSSILDVSSTTKGMLIPRVGLIAKNDPTPLSAPATSLIVYNTVNSGTGVNTVSPGYYYWDGLQWIRMVTDNNEAWSLNGNTGTNPLNHYIGTTDLTDFRIQTSGFPAMYFNANSNFVGLGDENPGENLVIKLNTRAIIPVPGNYSGVQIKPTLAVFGSANNYGLHIGLDNAIQTTARITNYEPGDLWFGLSNNDVLHLKNNSLFVGINEDSPADNLTIRLNPAAVVSGPDNYSGILLHAPTQAGLGNNNGLHIGLDNSLMTTARIMNSENGDLFLGTNKINMIHLKASNRYVGVNTDNPFHLFSLMIGTNAVFTLPYDGLSVMTPNNPANAASGLVVGSDPSDYVNKGVWNYDDGKIAFGTNNLERVTITNTGDVGIGTAAPSEKLHVIGNILASGTITPSDLRYKKNIQEINSPLSKLKQVRGVTYQYKTDEFPEMGFTDAGQIGFIAQEVEKVFPELVVTGKDGYKAVDYSKITPVLLEAIKDQQNQNDELNRKLEKLISVIKN
ncbi:MAG: tail fiber domain-containing protein [Ferruginibacter sp.]